MHARSICRRTDVDLCMNMSCQTVAPRLASLFPSRSFSHVRPLPSPSSLQPYIMSAMQGPQELPKRIVKETENLQKVSNATRRSKHANDRGTNEHDRSQRANSASEHAYDGYRAYPLRARRVYLDRTRVMRFFFSSLDSSCFSVCASFLLSRRSQLRASSLYHEQITHDTSTSKFKDRR